MPIATLVWGNAIKNNNEKIKKLIELYKYAEKVPAEEMADTDPSGFDKIDSEKVKSTINKINEALKGKEVDRMVKQKLNYAKKNWAANLYSPYKKSRTDFSFGTALNI